MSIIKYLAYYIFRFFGTSMQNSEMQEWKFVTLIKRLYDENTEIRNVEDWSCVRSHRQGYFYKLTQLTLRKWREGPLETTMSSSHYPVLILSLSPPGASNIVIPTSPTSRGKQVEVTLAKMWSMWIRNNQLYIHWFSIILKSSNFTSPTEQKGG